MIEYRPSTQEVATLLMARTRDEFGNLTGDFGSNTAVKPEQAKTAIDDAVAEVADAIGEEIPRDKLKLAKRVVILLAGANIEMSYFPDQAQATNSMYDKFMARYQKLLDALAADISAEESEQEHGDEIGATYGAFPPSTGWERKRW